MPIKRNDLLKPLSRDHHHALLLCWKIKSGLNKKIDPWRIKKYTDWFYQTHLKPHFEIEEKYVFSILSDKNAFARKAFADHEKISQLFESTLPLTKTLLSIVEELENHIRFEERILFDEVQNVATEEQLKSIITFHKDEKFIDNLTDTFWE